MKTNTQALTILNAIIRHGNHCHEEMNKEQFSVLTEQYKINNEDMKNEHLELTEAYNEITNNIESCEDDFYLDFDDNEYRLIADESIWDIYVEEIKNIVEDCYDLKLDSIPDFVAFEIDWDQTAKNAYVDGYGHTFAGYDGEETEAGGYWIFRVN